ncbi:uncharacterized protein [Prorops nasuta]|uniref:uncharacterized protein n=1 Tax=Prorops nasuta TaxID=863751 RepID=UPI0034CD2FF1
MRGPIPLSVLLVLIACCCASFTEANKHGGCSCGSLGLGKNPCNCGEFVVKAAKTTKPLLYASPEAIKEAAIGRTSERIISQYPACGCGSGPSTTVVEPIEVPAPINVVEPIEVPLPETPCTDTSANDKLTIPYEPRHLPVIDRNPKIVPNFKPIGDLCAPLQIQEGVTPYPNSITGEVVSKVTPAYPGKPRCICEKNRGSLVNCLDLLKGVTGNSEVLAESSNLATAVGGYGGSNFAAAAIGGQGSSNFAAAIGGQGSSNFAEAIGGYGSSNLAEAVGGYGSSNFAEAIGGYGSSNIANAIGGFGSSNIAGAIGGAGSTNIASAIGISPVGDFTHPRPIPTDYPEFPSDSSPSRPIFGGSNTFGDCDQDEVVYPQQVPIDPVSLSLAYKHVVAPIVNHYQRGRYVPEDRLAFGHRTIPTEFRAYKKVNDIPEERLVTSDKPVVELKAPSLYSLPAADIEDTENLAELEAYEREREEIESEIGSARPTSLLTYGDLGFAPVQAGPPNPAVWLPVARTSVSAPLINSGCPEGGCGPLGPPVPGYVPGNVFVREQQEFYGPEEAPVVPGIDLPSPRISNGEDLAKSTTGIIGKLRSSCRTGLL